MEYQLEGALRMLLENESLVDGGAFYTKSGKQLGRLEEEEGKSKYSNVLSYSPHGPRFLFIWLIYICVDIGFFLFHI
jgi:hypothetical protein